jgi:hypothetical protein
MKINLKTILSIGGAILVLAVIFAAYHYYPWNGNIKDGGPKNTPIVIAGGGLHGEVHKASDGWTAITSAERYSAPVPDKDIDDITITGYTGSPAQPITGTGGWTITFSTPHGDKDVELCSSEDCSGKSLDSSGTIYFGLDKKLGLFNELKSGSLIKEIHFHELGCYKGVDKDNETCDVPVKIEIKTANNVNVSSPLKCPLDGTACDVIIGKN